MNLIDIILAAKARISGGSEYQWKCYGPYARFLDFTVYDGLETISIVFDSHDQTIYEVEVYPVEDQNTRYVWYNPEFRSATFNEAEERNIDLLKLEELVCIEITNEKEILALIEKEMSTNNEVKKNYE